MAAQRHLALGSLLVAVGIAGGLTFVRCPREPPHADVSSRDALVPVPARAGIVGDRPAFPDAGLPEVGPVKRSVSRR